MKVLETLSGRKSRRRWTPWGYIPSARELRLLRSQSDLFVEMQPASIQKYKRCHYVIQVTK